jgi:hypothetical protein
VAASAKLRETSAGAIRGECFPARTALGWNVWHLDRAAEVSHHTVAHFERGGTARPTTVKTIQRALEKAGVIFIDANDGGPGARLGKEEPR